MKNSTKIVLVTLAAIVLVSTVAVLRPRVVHATSYTVNPTGARTPVTVYCVPEPTDHSNVAICSILNTSGAEIVIQTVSFTVNTTGPNTPVLEQVNTVNNEFLGIWLGESITFRALVSGGYYATTSSQTTLYSDPGTNISCIVTLDHHSDFANQQCTLVGYYVPTT